MARECDENSRGGWSGGKVNERMVGNKKTEGKNGKVEGNKEIKRTV